MNLLAGMVRQVLGENCSIFFILLKGELFNLLANSSYHII